MYILRVLLCITKNMLYVTTELIVVEQIFVQQSVKSLLQRCHDDRKVCTLQCWRRQGNSFD